MSSHPATFPAGNGNLTLPGTLCCDNDPCFVWLLSVPCLFFFRRVGVCVCVSIVLVGCRLKCCVGRVQGTRNQSRRQCTALERTRDTWRMNVISTGGPSFSYLANLNRVPHTFLATHGRGLLACSEAARPTVVRGGYPNPRHNLRAGLQAHFGSTLVDVS